MAKVNTTGKDKNRNYQPMKPDPTGDSKNNVDTSREVKEPPVVRPTAGQEIGSSIVRRSEADDED